MAIRKTADAAKVAQLQQKAPPPAAPQQVPVGELTRLVDAALADGNFSQNEAKRLEEGIKANPALKGEVAEHLRKALADAAGSSGAISISETALSRLGQTLGVDFKELFFRRQAQSKTVDHEVGAGLEKQAKTTADEHDAGKHREASETRLSNQKALRDSHEGVKGRPIGGLKGAAYDAGLQYAGVLEGKLDEKLSPEAKAFKDQVREPLVGSCAQCVNEIAKNPETMKALGDVGAAIKTGGLKEALGAAATRVGSDVVSATKLTEVNVDAVNAAVGGVTSATQRLVDLTKGTGVGAKLAEKAPGVVKAVTDLGAKATGAAAGTAQAASGAAQAAGGAAQVAGAGAKAGAQAVPGLHVAVGCVTTGLAATEFIGNCAHKPRDWKRIATAGAAVIGQAVGIFLPFVGAATTVAKLGADAAMNAHDKKHGKESPKTWNAADIAPSVSQVTGFAAPFLESAGYGDAASKLQNVNAKVAHLAEKGVNASDLASLPQAEREAMVSTLMACQAESEKLADEAKGTKHEPTMRLLGESFKTMLAAWRKSKNIDMSEDPAAEKKKAHGEAMEAAAKATTASAMADEASKAA